MNFCAGLLLAGNNRPVSDGHNVGKLADSLLTVKSADCLFSIFVRNISTFVLLIGYPE